MAEGDDRVVYSGKIDRELREKFRTRCMIAKVKMEDQVAILMTQWIEAETQRERDEILRSAGIE